jgi:hypothetical protein
MAKIIKVKCNGPGGHVNAVDLDKLLQPTVILKGKPSAKPHALPERLLQRCQFCTEGKVILTRELLETITKP